MRSPPPRWSITILTIPSRHEHLRRLLASLARTDFPARAEVVVVYNARTDASPYELESRIRRDAPGLPVTVFPGPSDSTIGGGRNLQLTLCRAPLVAFIDDDVTLKGEIFAPAEEALRRHPLGLVGLPSVSAETGLAVKPRASDPAVDRGDLRFCNVQGMFAAGYRELLTQVGGFNPRRSFWGEWTELNLRLWRLGFPTAYQMSAGHLEHWEDAPESPTRNMDGRETHVLWGLICTALEYDAVDVTLATETWWQLVEERYLAYSFGDRLSPTQLLRATLELMPRLSLEWPGLMQYRSQTRSHAFPFKPFHPLSPRDVERVLRYAEERIGPFRERAWSRPRPASSGRGLIRRLVGRLLQRDASALPPRVVSTSSPMPTVRK